MYIFYRFWADWSMYWFYNDLCKMFLLYRCKRYVIEIMIRFSNFSDGKVNIVGAFKKNIWKFPVVLKAIEKIKIKIRKNGNLYTKSVFDKTNFDFCVTLKKITVVTLHFYWIFLLLYSIHHII